MPDFAHYKRIPATHPTRFCPKRSFRSRPSGSQNTLAEFVFTSPARVAEFSKVCDAAVSAMEGWAETVRKISEEVRYQASIAYFQPCLHCDKYLRTTVDLDAHLVESKECRVSYIHDL